MSWRQLEFEGRFHFVCFCPKTQVAHRLPMGEWIHLLLEAKPMQALAVPDQSHSEAMPSAASRAPAVMASPGEYLSFRLGREAYGLALPCIQEIRSYQQPTRIAGASEEVCGILNLRGTIIPIVDLRIRFQVEAIVDALTAIVIVNVRGQAVGVVVDSVSDVAALTADDIKPAPALGGMACLGHITGIACVNRDGAERMLVLLDIDQLVVDASVPSDMSDPASGIADAAS
jgi:purine-binding chemotaxis protein CheW